MDIDQKGNHLVDDIGLTTDNDAMDNGFKNDPGDLKDGYDNSDRGSKRFSTEKVDIPLSEGVGKKEKKPMLTIGFITSVTFAALFVVSYFLFLCRKCTRGRKPQSDHLAIETFPLMDPQSYDYKSLEEVMVHTCQRYYETPVRVPDDLEEVHTCQRYFGMPVRMPDNLEEVRIPATVPPKKRVRFCLPDGRIVSSHMEPETPIEPDNSVFSMAIGSQLESGGPVIQQCGPFI